MFINTKHGFITIQKYTNLDGEELLSSKAANFKKWMIKPLNSSKN